MANGHDNHRVRLFVVPIQRNVPAPPSRDHEFAEFIVAWPTDPRMTAQDLDGIDDEPGRFHRGRWIGLEQEVSQPLEIEQGAP